MGTSQSSSGSKNGSSTGASQSSSLSGGCPVRAPGISRAADAPTAALQGGCPVRAPGGQGAPAGGLDPTNMMPPPNQQPAPGQSRTLSVERVESTIPQADGASRWVYPSPQMFYNALMRKGKAEGGEEDHMDAVVAIHNNMNERTWKAVLEWEKRHYDECKHPTLARFMGRPTELSVEARTRYWLTGQLPFDRHDWFVNRCGRKVRYVIDYYDVPSQQEHDELPHLADTSAVKSIELVVRPALDSAEAAADRAAVALGDATAALRARTGLPAATSPQRAQADHDGGESHTSAASPAASPAASSAGGPLGALREACRAQFDAVGACEGDEACAHAHLGLVLCMAKQVCEADAARFEKALNAEGAAADEERGAAFGRMQECLSKYAADSRKRGGAA
ncbi:hypothetical protein KFE25_009845 [Diacronema lutheri]|uniref:Holocytochrome c-type synthase n=2 Tax=Diacronema lutheri TaxID=2081491 RepID=A0A8J6C476_DIALT|nr:hypothetical protein KFE25_009845 [Diacronema lutheri]